MAGHAACDPGRRLRVALDRMGDQEIKAASRPLNPFHYGSRDTSFDDRGVLDVVFQEVVHLV